MPFKKNRHPYVTVLSVLLALTIFIYSFRLFSIQLVNREKYNAGASGITTRTASIPAARGEILDCNGRKIAVNRDGYDVVLNSAYLDKKNINSLLKNLISLCEEYGDEYVDNLPITKSGVPEFEGNNAARAKLIKFLGLADYATANDCFLRLVEKYQLEAFDDSLARKIMGVRYSMDSAGFGISYPYTFAEDVGSALMLKISETHMILSGVTIEITPYREYTVSTLAPHLIGKIGPIYEEEWEEYRDKGYSYNDKIGKSGIEAWAEEYLHGIDGEITYKIDSHGNILSSEVTKEPIQGKTVMLTLDKSLQLAAQNSLQTTITDLQSQGNGVTGGALVVMDVATGGILASANYPSYDLNTLSQEYDALVSDTKYTPLLDRAFQGIYPIGSTVKPLVAIAAMQNGKYNAGEIIKCVRTYKYFADYQPECMHYHGDMMLNAALARSCNYFFYELGRRIGINSLNQYFKDYGLGVKTGVEINDSSGLLVEFESDSGNTIQVAIGQLNAFTPLQLASYTATVANGGTRYKATLIDGIVSPDKNETFFELKPSPLKENYIEDNILSAVKEGMLSVTTDGTGSTVFSDYPIQIGGKTGTAQATKGAEHSVFIAFAPYDNPEIVVSLVLEHANSTFSATSVARQVLDEYFFGTSSIDKNVLPYEVLE